MDYWREQLERPWPPRGRADDDEPGDQPGSWGRGGNGSAPPVSPGRSPGPLVGSPGPAAPPPGRAGDDRAQERAARATAVLLAVGVAAAVIGLVVFFTVRTLRTGDGGRVTTAPPLTTPEDAARVVGGVGPAPGTDVVTYAAARRQALAAATGDRVAVVSLNAYTSETKARALVGQAEVLGLLAAAPGGAPALVAGPMQAWVGGQTAEARAERDEIQRLIPTSGNDPAFQRFYREEVERLNKLLNAIKPDGDLVFAVVVRAPVADLRALAGSGEVRLVDVGPEGAAASTARGLRPEETSKANEPNTRPPP